MVKDNNVLSAWPVMDLASMGKCSTYKYNLTNRFYQCRLFSLQYDPKQEQIRHVTINTPLQYHCNADQSVFMGLIACVLCFGNDVMVSLEYLLPCCNVAILHHMNSCCMELPRFLPM